MPTKKSDKPKRGYWYKTYYSYCPVCADTEVIEKVRIYDRPKPKEWSERNETDEYACWSHFM